MLGYFHSITGIVKVKVLETVHDSFFNTDYVMLEVTSRKNPLYPRGFKFSVLADSPWLTDRNNQPI